MTKLETQAEFLFIQAVKVIAAKKLCGEDCTSDQALVDSLNEYLNGLGQEYQYGFNRNGSIMDVTITKTIYDCSVAPESSIDTGDVDKEDGVCCQDCRYYVQSFAEPGKGVCQRTLYKCKDEDSCKEGKGLNG